MDDYEINRRRRGQKVSDHGLTGTPENIVWQSMRQRCRNPKHAQYKNYGGRGIKVCARWDSFPAFLEDMGPRPEGATLERLDVNGDYCPDNCVWADWKTQHRNKRGTIYVRLNGETRPMTEWCERFGVKYHTTYRRARILHWPKSRWFEPPRGIGPEKDAEILALLDQGMSQRDVAAAASVSQGYVSIVKRRNRSG